MTKGNPSSAKHANTWGRNKNLPDPAGLDIDLDFLVTDVTADNLADCAKSGQVDEIRFFATTKEIQDWLISCLPSEHAPYKLLTIKQKRVASKRHIPEVIVHEIQDFAKVASLPDHPTSYSIWSQEISPSLQIAGPDATSLERLWLLSGLPCLQHGHKPEACSSFSVQSEIVHKPTGIISSHGAYFRLFHHMARLIRKHLVLSVISTAKQDSESKLDGMTLAAAKENAHPPWIKPGRRLKK